MSGWTKFRDVNDNAVREDPNSECPICGARMSKWFAIGNGQTATNCTGCTFWLLGGMGMLL